MSIWCMIFGHDWEWSEWKPHPIKIVDEEHSIGECRRCDAAAIKWREVE